MRRGVDPPAIGRRPRAARRMESGCLMPRPTSVNVPAMARTILYRKPFASTSIEDKSPSRETRQKWIVRTLDAGSAFRLETLEVVRPFIRLAASFIATTSSRFRTFQDSFCKCTSATAPSWIT